MVKLKRKNQYKKVVVDSVEKNCVRIEARRKTKKKKSDQAARGGNQAFLNCPCPVRPCSTLAN